MLPIGDFRLVFLVVALAPARAVLLRQHHELRRVAFARIGHKQTGELDPPLAVGNLADVGDVARLKRQPLQHRGDSRVRILALDFHQHAVDAVGMPFVNVVNQIDFAGAIQVAQIALHVGEDVADAAVFPLKLDDVGVHLGLVEILAGGQVQLLHQLRRGELRVARDADLADVRADAFIDDEGHREPTLIGVEFQFAADAGLKIAQTAVKRGDAVDVFVDFLEVGLPAEEIEERRLRLGHGPLDVIGADDRGADDIDPPYPRFRPFIDGVDRAELARLVPLHDGDADLVVAFFVIEVLQPGASRLNLEGIGGVAGLEADFLLQRLLLVIDAADDVDLLQNGPLDEAEDDDSPAGHALRKRLHPHERPQLLQPHHVLLDHFRIVGPPLARVDLGENLFDRDGPIPLNLDLHDQVLRGLGGDDRLGRRRSGRIGLRPVTRRSHRRRAVRRRLGHRRRAAQGNRRQQRATPQQAAKPRVHWQLGHQGPFPAKEKPKMRTEQSERSL